MTIGVSYFVAGLIPLIPYLLVDNVIIGLYASSLVTIVCLLVFGYIKALFTSPEKALWGAIQTAFVGGIAAGERIFISNKIMIEIIFINLYHFLLKLHLLEAFG